MSNEITTPYDRVLIDPNEPLILPDGTAITGRLETFLYALCCLDYDNLPTPLSRIEEFANALITGEIPNIEPQSRSEQFFLAILDGNIDNLPEPQSRSEVLLNKLAVGDFDLTNVDPIQSRYELLLAYLIKNGGVGNLDYVLYEFYQATQTLYNTQEKPVKSAILKGNTLVNLLKKSNIKITSSAFGYISYAHNLDVTKTYILQYRINQIPELTDVTDSGRLCKFEWYNGSISNGYLNIYNKNITVGTNNFIIINPFSAEVIRTSFGVWCPSYASGILDMDIILMEYQEGMENWDIPYFEGIQSVKMPVLTTTGKNLFNLEKWASKIDIYPARYEFNISGDVISGIIKDGRYFIEMNPEKGEPLKLNTTYTLSHQSSNCTTTILFYKPDLSLIKEHIIKEDRPTMTFTTPNEPFVVVFRFGRRQTNTGDFSFRTEGIQLEENSTYTDYEPYKSNILTVNEEVELRGIGEVQDELNLITGEYIQKTGTINTNKINNWTIHSYSNEDFLLAYTSVEGSNQTNTKPLCNKFPTWYNSAEKLREQTSEYVWGVSNGIFVWIKKSKLTSADVNGLKEYFTNNLCEFVYSLNTESIKTVDLSVIDQDGNVLPKIKTFNNITYVNVSSDGILPKVEMEVATYNEEDIANANIMTASMDEIYSVQNELDNTNSIQSEEIDSTMIASTEIYENIL